MSILDDELDRRLRAELHAWADEAPRARAELPLAAPRRTRSMRRWARLAVPVGAAAAMVAAVLVVRGDETRAVNVIGRPDVVTAEVHVGERRGVRVLAAGDGALFVASENDRRLYRVDARTGDVLEGPALAVPDSVAVTDGSVFAIVDAPARLARLDPGTLAIERAVALDAPATTVNVVDGRLWLRLTSGDVERRDPATLARDGSDVFRLTVGFQAVGRAGLWRTDLDAHVLRRLDPGTGAVLTTIRIDGAPRAVAVGDDAVWVTDTANDRVLRIDPIRERVVASIPVGRFPHSLALGADRLWVANFEDGTLSTIDTTADAVRSTVPIGVRPGSMLLVDGQLWVAIHQEALLRKVDPSALDTAALRPAEESELHVDVGGRSLFIRCLGAAHPEQPTVVLEAGAYDWSEHWLFVQLGLQARGRVCAYDRAGLGRSDPGAEPRTAGVIADDLWQALERSGIVGPYVLVAHGYGGLYARMFASRHRDVIRGLVLVDAVTPTFFDDAWPLLTDDQRSSIDESFTSDAQLGGSRQSFEQVAAAGTLGDTPLVVIARDEARGGLGAELEALWRRHQRDELSLSSDSRFVVADGVGTSIPTDAPNLIVDAVDRIARGS
jgi:YVTN family beta-propeller protein